MSPEQLEDFITDVRLPALRAQRDAISAQLAELFNEIGYLTDPDWAFPKDIEEVHRLLAGPDAPAPTFNMPAAARHHALQVQRRNIDRAIEQARVYEARCAARRQANATRPFQIRINEIERDRVQTAVRLQAINERREALREEILEAGGAVVLPTDSVDLLGLPSIGDPVDWATVRVITDKIMTKSEISDAKR